MANEERQSAPGPFARLLTETLARLASAEISERIVKTALVAEGLSRIPEDAATFGSFACGPLCDAVEDQLGAEAAEAVLTDLGPAFVSDDEGENTSGVRRRKRHSLQAPTENAPVVLIASGRPAEVDALVPRLRDRVKVVAAYDIFALLQAAQKYMTAPITLLLNDAMPAIRPSTLATLARVLPPGTRVIVWGDANVVPENREQTTSVEWIRMGRVEELDAVADMCLAMLPKSLEEADEPPAPVEAPRVVVAHRDATWRAAASRALEDAGYEPMSVPDGFMALERCIDERPAAVVAGIHMPTLDGPQLAALLRSRFPDDLPSVILVTDGELPEPPAGVVAVIDDREPPEDIVAQVRAWIGPGAA